MNPWIAAVIVSALAAATSGCAGLGLGSGDKAGRLFDRAGVDVIVAPSNSQHIYFKDRNSTEQYCRGSGPDFAVTTGQGVALSLTSIPTQPGLGEDTSRGALGLGGRNPEVLVARELMYRACELTVNLGADRETALKIYQTFLDAVVQIAKMQTGLGSQSVAATPTDARTQAPSGAGATRPADATTPSPATPPSD